MQEVLLYYPEVKDIRPSAKLEDLHLLKEIAARFGYKIRLGAKPDSEEKHEIVRIFCFCSIFFSLVNYHYCKWD